MKKNKVRKILKDKKAMFFTIGAFLLMLSLITVMSISGRTENIAKDLAIDRTFEISDSVERCILDIFFEFANLQVKITKNPDGTVDVSFKESLQSREDWTDNFFAKVRKFEEFVRSKEPTLLINLAEIEDMQMKMTIKPHNVSYSAEYEHQGKIDLVTTPSPGEPPNFGAIELVIDAGDTEEIKDVKHNLVPITYPDPNGIYFNVTGTDSTLKRISVQEYVDIYDDATVRVQFSSNTLFIYIAEGEISISSNEQLAIDVETKIRYLEETDERVRITVYDSVINNSLPGLGVYRMDDVVIEAEEL